MEYSDYLDAFVREFGLGHEDTEDTGVSDSDLCPPSPSPPQAFTTTGMSVTTSRLPSLIEDNLSGRWLFACFPNASTDRLRDPVTCFDTGQTAGNP
jgi:hypothetical protein